MALKTSKKLNIRVTNTAVVNSVLWMFIGNPFALFLEATLTLDREWDYDAHMPNQMNNVVTNKVNPSKYRRAFQFHFVVNRSILISKYQNIV